MKRLTLKNPQQEVKFFFRRTLIIVFAVFVLACTIGSRLYYLQIYQHDIYTTLSNNNQLGIVPIEPNRGLIFDRNGVLLADNVASFSLELIPNVVKNVKATIKELQKIIPVSEVDITAFRKQLQQSRKFEFVPLRLNLTEEEIAKFSVNQHLFPGVEIKARLMRHYPLGSSFVHVLGYVGRINEQELKEIDSTNYRASHFIGKLGVEKSYEDILHGTVGHEQVEVDATGRVIRVLKRTPPIGGSNLYLSLDSKMQQLAEKAFNDTTGALVALSPQTGEIFALVSVPTYDPQPFVRGISGKEYKALLNDKNRPLYNRTIRGQYPFASTIKPFLAAGGLNENIVTMHTKIRDPGYYILPRTNLVFKDWILRIKKTGHGTVDIMRAIIVSCDTYFYTLAHSMGVARMNKILTGFGFGKLTNVDLPDELPGLVPSDAWKRKAKGAPWYPGDTISAGIGQGYTMTTPLQLASGTATLSMRGQSMVPHVLLKQHNADQTIVSYKPTKAAPLVLRDPEIWGNVITAMQQVIKSPEGTAVQKFGQTSYSAAAKTGTAQVFSSKTHTHLDEKNLPTRLRHLQDHSLFIVFAPVENPQIAVAVVAENSKIASKIARQVLDYYFKVPTPAEYITSKQEAVLPDPNNPNAAAPINEPSGRED